MFRVFLLSAASFAATQTAIAAELPSITQADAVVVTATRTPQPATRVGSSVSVLDAATLERLQTIAVVDALRDVPGVAFSRNGGIGGVTTVRIRGAEGDQTVTLIDGVKLNDPSSPGGGFNFANLLVGNLDRIEVLRGPQSTLYGSQALGGVVSIITRTGDGPLTGSLSAEAGELATTNFKGDVRGAVGRVRFSLGAGAFRSDSISALNERRGGTERDSYENTGATGRLAVDLTEALELDARVYWSQSDVGIDGFPAPRFQFADTPERSKAEELVGYLGLNLTLLDGRSRTRLAFTRTTIDRQSLNPASTVPVTFDGLGDNERVELQSTLQVTDRFELVGGGEIETARLRTASPSTFNPNPTPLRASADLSGVYLQAQARPTDTLTATIGVRRSDDDRFGDAINVRATVAWVLNDGATILRASAADAFKAPTPFQLFSDFGNATLLPEEASAVDVGVEHALAGRRLIGGLTYFRRDATNQIDFASCFNSTSPICVGRPFGTYDNIARAFAEGVEATLEWRPTDAFTVSAAFTALETENRSPGSGNRGRKLARRPDSTTAVSVAYRFASGLDFSSTLSVVGESFDNAANTVRLKGYELLAVRASYPLTERVTVFARVENAADAAYETTATYGSPPRQAFFGVRASF